MDYIDEDLTPAQIEKRQREQERQEAREKLALEISEIIKNYGRPPTNAELADEGLSQSKLRHHFGTVAKAVKAALDLVLNDLYVLGEIDTLKAELMEADVKEHYEKGGAFFLAQMGAGCFAHSEILRTLELFEKLGFFILLFPGADPARKNSGILGKDTLFFDSRLRKYAVVQRDFKIGPHVTIGSMLTSTKQINPLTGLDNISSPYEVTIIGSPKQCITPMANLAKHPGELCSTGTITCADYSSSKYFSQRTAKIAEKKHQLGGIALEFNKETGKPSTTNILFKDNGDTYFKGKLLRAKTKRVSKAKVPAVTLPDVHLSSTWKHLVKLIDEIRHLNPKVIFVHDDLDNESINPHKEKFAHIGTKLTPIFENYYDEAQNYVRFCERMLNTFEGQIVSVFSNHPQFLERFISAGDHVKVRDKKSYKLLHEIAKRMADAVDRFGRPNKSPTQILVEILRPDLVESGRFKWLLAHEGFNVCGIECGQHGHVGKQGSRSPSTQALLKMLGPNITGHGHFREVKGLGYRVSSIYGGGHSRPAYALKGADIWSIDYAVIYDNLHVQLVSTEIS